MRTLANLRPSRRSASLTAVIAMIAATGVALPFAPPAAAVGGTVLTNEAFSGASVVDPNWKTGGKGGSVACLTASTNTTQAGIPGCKNPAPGVPVGGDTPGSGALRLTGTSQWTSGYALYDVALPFQEGFVVEFDQYQYGGSGADGIGFFLADGAAPTFVAGADGGSLGYAQRSGQPGVPQGYYGVGLDAFGNFANDNEGRGAGCSIHSLFNTTKPNTITTRGPGNGTTGYCWRRTSGVPQGTPLSPRLRTAGPTRTAPGTRQGFRITLNTDVNIGGVVTVERNMYDGNGYQLVLDDALPSNHPATIKFGFLASTGSATDIHEITNARVTTLNGVAKLVTTIAQDAPGVAGGTGNLTVNVSSDPAEGTGANPVTVVSNLPTGVTTTGTPSGAGWNCSASTASKMSCTRTPGVYPPGTAFPAISIPVAYSNDFSTNTQLVSATATALDAGPGEGHTTLNVTPVAVDDADTTDAAVPVLVDVQANDLGDLDLTSITVPAKGTPGGPSHGTAVPDATGEVLYTPDTTPGHGWSGVDTFNYTIYDYDGQAATATVTVTTLPVAENDAAGTELMTPVDIDVLTNDHGNFTTPSSVTQGANGSVVINPDGTVKYTPNALFSGIDVFTYTVTDGAGQTATATVTVDVSPWLHPFWFTTPVGVNHNLDVTSAFFGAPGTAVWSTLTIVIPPVHGSAAPIAGVDGGIAYTAPANWSGTGYFTYSVEDTFGNVTIGIAIYTVTPVANDDAYTVNSGSATTFDVLANDKGSLDPATVAVTGGPSHGYADVNPDGTITYTSDDTFSGVDSFDYVVYDDEGQPASATVTITVNPTSQPAAVSLPVGDSETVEPLTGATGDLNAASLTINQPLPHGTWSWDSATWVGLYTSTDNWSGVQNLTYTVCDNQATPVCTTSPLVITTTPTAADDTATTLTNTPVAVDVLSNDKGSLDPGTVTVTSGPAHGATSVNPATGVVTYTPAAGYVGADEFTYSVSDGTTTVTATVYITVTGTPVPPTPGPGPNPTPTVEPTPGPTPSVTPTPTPSETPTVKPTPPAKVPQKPLKPVPFPTDVTGNGTTVLIPAGGVPTNAGQKATVTVACATLKPSKATSKSLCKVKKNKNGKVTVTIHSREPIRVRVTLTAPATSTHTRYWATHQWISDVGGLGNSAA